MLLLCWHIMIVLVLGWLPQVMIPFRTEKLRGSKLFGSRSGSWLLTQSTARRILSGIAKEVGPNVGSVGPSASASMECLLKTLRSAEVGPSILVRGVLRGVRGGIGCFSSIRCAI